MDINYFKGNKDEITKVGSVTKIDGKLSYVTHRKPQHFFILFNGFGLSTKVLSDLILQEVEEIFIIYTTTKGEQIVYNINLNFFLKTHYAVFNNKLAKSDDIQVIIPKKLLKVLE